MTGKDLLIVLGDISHKYYNEAEMETVAAVSTRKSIRRSMLIAAVIALTLLLVGCAVGYACGWLTSFFTAQSGEPLSSEQVSYIERNEQIIGQSQTRDGWTVQVKSAINDGRTAYIILGITAPEDVDLESSGADEYYLSGAFADLVSNSRHIEEGSGHAGWVRDDDGLSNTLDYMIRWEPMEKKGMPYPFGPDVQWNIHIENILCQRENTEYLLELLNGKYKGQDNVMFTEEETDKLYQKEIIAEGVWNFAFTFDQSSSGIELLSSPVTVKGYASRNANEVSDSYEDVLITSFTLNTFSAVIHHEADACVTFTAPENGEVAAVMRDGSEIEISHWSASRDTTELNSNIPIVLSEVDHIRMPDGTVLPMPE